MNDVQAKEGKRSQHKTNIFKEREVDIARRPNSNNDFLNVFWSIFLQKFRV
jgi:hypothetical protein